MTSSVGSFAPVLSSGRVVDWFNGKLMNHSREGWQISSGNPQHLDITSTDFLDHSYNQMK